VIAPPPVEYGAHPDHEALVRALPDLVMAEARATDYPPGHDRTS
jgi:hypothetical protein